MGKLYKALEKVEKGRVPEFEEDILAEGRQSTQETAPEPERKPYMGLPREATMPAMDEKLVVYREPGSIAAEQFRKLRTQLLGMKLPETPKTIMVTSATDSEGKTLVAANLGLVLSHDLHTHALLVDADLRNPALSRWFGLHEGRGLSDYLAAGASIPGLLTKTTVEKLTILSSGTFQANPVELIGSKPMEALVHEMRERYSDRYIIFDSSPLLATTEPSVLTRLVDGIILVVRAGVTPRETVQQALATVDRDKVLGIVLNELEFESGALSSRYFGSAEYYYRYKDKQKAAGKPPRGWRSLFPFFKKED
ncbi:MAG TPA: polysaccharide biosynthesis tyrosine autokinase [Syntrophales bacterium]|nr:polysaccharide biosynthesis tyrosine autokinase [Syntrophales bacterium]